MEQYADQRRKAKDTDSHRRYSLLHLKSTQSLTQDLPSSTQEGTTITAVRSGKYVTQNASMFKKANLGPCQREEEGSDDGDDDDRAEKHLNCSQNNDRNEDLT